MVKDWDSCLFTGNQKNYPLKDLYPQVSAIFFFFFFFFFHSFLPFLPRSNVRSFFSVRLKKRLGMRIFQHQFWYTRVPSFESRMRTRTSGTWWFLRTLTPLADSATEIVPGTLHFVTSSNSPGILNDTPFVLFYFRLK